MLGITSGGDFRALKGVVEAVLARLNSGAVLEVSPCPKNVRCSDGVRSCQLLVAGELLGFLGEVSGDGLRRFDLRGKTTIAELKLAVLSKMANLVPQYQKLPPFPAVERDLNLVVDERVSWAAIATAVREGGGAYLEELAYCDTYRDAERLGQGKKSILLSMKLRDAHGTLAGQQADAIRDEIVARWRHADLRVEPRGVLTAAGRHGAHRQLSGAQTIASSTGANLPLVRYDNSRQMSSE